MPAAVVAVLALASLPTANSAFTALTGNASSSFESASWATNMVLDGGFEHMCGVNDLGGVSCWGRNARGQVGDNSTSDRRVPTDVVGPGGVGLLADAAGIAVGQNHSCALTTAGTVWCWGENQNGQLGNNTTTNSSAPVQVRGLGGVGTLTGATRLAAAHDHSCVVTATGAVWCWGQNDRGQLGNNTTSDSSVPVQVRGPGGVGTFSDAIQISAGEKHTCAIKTGGTVWCWGENNDGQLGNNTTTNSSSPVQVTGPGGTGTLTGATGIAAGRTGTCVIQADTSVWCWGKNDRGQLGNNTTTDSSSPVQVRGPGGVGTFSGATRIALGDDHACVVRTGRTAWCWGRNDRGQLGNNTTTNSSTPVQVLGPGGTGTFSEAIEIGAGDRTSCAGRSDATVWCWGHNNRGQLGNNTTADSSTPVQAIGF